MPVRLEITGGTDTLPRRGARPDGFTAPCPAVSGTAPLHDHPRRSRGGDVPPPLTLDRHPGPFLETCRPIPTCAPIPKRRCWSSNMRFAGLADALPTAARAALDRLVQFYGWRVSAARAPPARRHGRWRQALLNAALAQVSHALAATPDTDPDALAQIVLPRGSPSRISWTWPRPSPPATRATAPCSVTRAAWTPRLLRPVRYLAQLAALPFLWDQGRRTDAVAR